MPMSIKTSLKTSQEMRLRFMAMMINQGTIVTTDGEWISAKKHPLVLVKY